MQASQANVRAAAAVMVGDFVRSLRGSDVNLNYNQIGLVVQIESFNVLVLQTDVVVIVEISGESGKPQRRKQGIFDRTPERAFGFGQRRQDHFDFHLDASYRIFEATAAVAAHCKVVCDINYFVSQSYYPQKSW